MLIQRRGAEAELAEAALASIVENSHDAISSSNSAGTIVTWNSGAVELYGYSKDEIRDQPISPLVPADRLIELKEVLRNVGNGRTVSDLETVCLSQAGRQIPVSMTLSPSKGAGNANVGVSVMLATLPIGSRRRASCSKPRIGQRRPAGRSRSFSPP